MSDHSHLFKLVSVKGTSERWKCVSCERVDGPQSKCRRCGGYRHEARPTLAPPPCASWCGGATSMLPPQRTLWFNDGKNENPIFCTEACRDAGVPRNPGKP